MVTALGLCRHGTEVTLIHREPELSRQILHGIRPDTKNRIQEGSIGAFLGAQAKEIAGDWTCLKGGGGNRLALGSGFVLAPSGHDPDFGMLRRGGVESGLQT